MHGLIVRTRDKDRWSVCYSECKILGQYSELLLEQACLQLKSPFILTDIAHKKKTKVILKCQVDYTKSKNNI